jgi:hypothetical protein
MINEFSSMLSLRIFLSAVSEAPGFEAAATSFEFGHETHRPFL